MSIIPIHDVLDLRARQRKELAFYTEKKQQLERHLSILHRDLQLTDYIIRLIESEHQDEHSINGKRTDRTPTHEAD